MCRQGELLPAHRPGAGRLVEAFERHIAPVDELELFARDGRCIDARLSDEGGAEGFVISALWLAGVDANAEADGDLGSAKG